MAPETILFVDDDAGLLRLHQLVLKGKVGCDICVAQTGQDAIEQIKRQRPALVILDLMMPEMNGIEVCRWIRAQPELAAIPVVILTGLDDKAVHLTARESGANAIWQKPLAPSELKARISQILATGQVK